MTNEQKKQKMDSNANGKGLSSTEPVSDEEQKALAIVEQKENLPKELSIVIDNYQRNRTTTNACNFLKTFRRRLLLLLVEDIYQEGFEWCPLQVQTAVEVFPDVWPNAFFWPNKYVWNDYVDTAAIITNQHIRDKAKMISVLEKKDDLPHEMRKAIDCFKGDFVKSELTVPKQFLVYMKNEIIEFITKPSKRTHCRYDPHEFETMLRLFPKPLHYLAHFLTDESGYDEEYNPKAFSLLPMLLQLGNDLGVVRCSDDEKLYEFNPVLSGILKGLLYVNRDYESKFPALIEETCISILEDFINRKLLSKQQIIESEFRSIKFGRWCGYRVGKCSITYANNEYDKRFRYLVKLVPIEKRERYYEDVLEPRYQFNCDEFRRYLDAYLYWFPTEMGRLFMEKENLLSKTYYWKVSEYEPIVFELLEFHLAEATQETRLGMMAYAAANALVPRKFLHFIVRREVLQVVNGFEGTMQQSL